MNQDKAREYFSAYYEGTLEAGLLQSFETRLRSDATLQADYAAFAETMEELRSLSHEEIEIPIFLSDRIATRLEEERARKQKTTPVWSMWLRGLSFAGLAAVALVGAVWSFHSSGNSSMATFGPGVPASDQMTFTGTGPTATLTYRPSSERTVVVSSGANGREIERFTVDGSSPAHPFVNQLPGTALFQIQVLGAADSSFLAVPGSNGSSSAPGEGTLKEMAVAVASRYHMPVLLRTKDTAKHVTWQLEKGDPTHFISSALETEHLAVSQGVSGVITISDN